MGLQSCSLTLTGAFPRLCRREGTRAGLGLSVWPCLDLLGPDLSAHQNCMLLGMCMVSEQRLTAWDDLGSESL